jgi:hypothetical protein
MSWFDIDPKFHKYTEQGGYTKLEAISVNARVEPVGKITVETTTDWAIVMIGVGTITSAMLTALFSYLGQRQQTKASSEGLKNQVRANAANLRNIWMEQLRTVAAEFVQCAAICVNGVQKKNLEEQDLPFLQRTRDQALLLNIKLKFYVGTSSVLGKSIVSASDRILVSTNKAVDAKRDNADFDVKGFYRQLAEMEELIVLQLEQAWAQAKGDLGFTSDYPDHTEN